MALSKTTKVFLIISGVLFALLIVAVIGIVYAIQTMGKPEVADNSVLILNISGSLPDYAADEPLAKAVLQRAKQSNRTLTESEVAQIVREVR